MDIKLLNNANIVSICLSVFFLPISLNLNNIFLSLFIAINFFLFFVNRKHENVALLKNNIILIFLVSLPFWLNAVGLIYSDELSMASNYVVRALPFLLLPIIAVINPEIFRANCKKMGYALVFGCLLVALWSWFFSIKSILEEQRSISDLFGPVYSHHNLLKHLDMHAAYLSIFIYTGIGFLVLEIKGKIKSQRVAIYLLIVVLLAFMFHLLSRNAIIYFLIAAFGYLFYLRQWKIIAVSFVVLFGLAYMAYNTPKNYLRDRLFNNLNFLEKKTQFSKKDDRFDRLSASYEIFLEKPIFGYGTAAEDKHRQKIFKRNRDNIAYEKEYNSHNQFFEYLSTFGVLGGLVYIVFFVYLFNLVVRDKNYFLLFLLSGLFLGCITESIFERSWGVVYTSLLICLIISYKHKKTPIKC